MIEVTSLRKTYDSGFVLDIVDLIVHPGEIFSFLGPNGAGKTTTIGILTTLLPKDQGEVIIAGHHLDEDPDAIRQSIGVVSQENSFDVSLTVLSNLEVSASLQGIEEPRNKALNTLGDFGLKVFADRKAGTLSGGQQRKLCLAMGMIHRPRVLFLDEPTTGLDIESRNDFWVELKRAQTWSGTTIFLTTHDLTEAEKMSDRVAIINEGQIVEQNTMAELRKRYVRAHPVEELYLESTRAEVSNDG